MRNNQYFFLILFLGMALGACQKEDLRPVSAGSLNSLADCPNIESFVEEHFPDLSIRKVDHEKRDNQRVFDVYLTGDVELEFNQDCDIIEIETVNGIPHSALMPGIVEYVSINFPNTLILEWELYPNYQEITLSNGKEIKSDLSGQLYGGGSEECVEIKRFVETHFPTQSILKIELDDDEDRLYYDVYLTGNVNLEFNLQCEIIEIETKDGIPASALMSGIVEYVAANFSDRIILAWELYPNYQEIYLDNDTEIIFDLNGNFIRIDD